MSCRDVTAVVISESASLRLVMLVYGGLVGIWTMLACFHIAQQSFRDLCGNS